LRRTLAAGYTDFMERGGMRRWVQGRAAIAGLVVLLLTLALPSEPETKLSVPDPIEPPAPPLLEAEDLYPNPLRTVLELEAHYIPTQDEPIVATEESPLGAFALTFDTEIPRGGEARQTVNEILDVLQREHVHATFFIVGTWARANPEVLRRIAGEGHEIASHSFDHRPCAGRRTADLRIDLQRVAALVESETGHQIAPLFRPPYGCVDQAAVRQAHEQGYTLVGWTATGADAHGSTSSPLEVVASLERNLDAGAVVLLHTNRWITAAALPAFLEEARERRLEPLPLSEALAREAVSRDELERRTTRPCGSLLAHRSHRPLASEG